MVATAWSGSWDEPLASEASDDGNDAGIGHGCVGLLIALDHLDEVIALIRAAHDRDIARSELMARFGLTYIQAQSILELRLQQLTALESDAIRREHADIMERIEELRELLGDEGMVFDLIKTELTEISERYGDERRTITSRWCST